MPFHTPSSQATLDCTYQDLLISAQSFVLPAMAATGNPNYAQNFQEFVQRMWDHYSNTTASWGGCNWWENRLYAQHQGPGNPFLGWYAIRSTANPNSNQYMKLTAKIQWAHAMKKYCCSHRVGV